MFAFELYCVCWLKINCGYHCIYLEWTWSLLPSTWAPEIFPFSLWASLGPRVSNNTFLDQPTPSPVFVDSLTRMPIHFRSTCKDPWPDVKVTCAYTAHMLTPQLSLSYQSLLSSTEESLISSPPADSWNFETRGITFVFAKWVNMPEQGPTHPVVLIY